MPVCAECRRDLHAQSPTNLCTICGEHLGWGDLRFSQNPPTTTNSLCRLCERAKPSFQQAVAYGVYEGTLRGLIHLLKYERIATVAGPMGELLANAVAGMENLPDRLTVIPVPLHTTKERERGFNQTVLLAEAAVRVLRRNHRQMRFEPAMRALGRRRRTESQSGLSSRQRRLNLRGAFFIAQPERVSGRQILLLDDIYTTGATARECTRTLLNAGASRVYVATLARSQREGVAFWDFAATAEGMEATKTGGESVEASRFV